MCLSHLFDETLRDLSCRQTVCLYFGCFFLTVGSNLVFSACIHSCAQTEQKITSLHLHCFVFLDVFSVL